jgi:hypothetical protein
MPCAGKRPKGSAPAICATDLANLAARFATYPPLYDEVLDEVHGRIALAGYATKLDLGALAAWKRLNCNTSWMERLQLMPNATVIAGTAAAFAPGLAVQARITKLQTNIVHGMGSTFAFGSAVLTAWNPHDFAVIDRRVLRTLDNVLPSLGCTCDLRYYATYLEHVVDIRNQLNAFPGGHVWTARDVDKALF